MISDNVFTVLYKFNIFKGKEEAFIKNWTEATELIYKNEGSLGSRLHKIESNVFFAYALWPNKETFENASKLEPSLRAQQLKEERQSIVDRLTIEYKSEILVDLIKEETYKN